MSHGSEAQTVKRGRLSGTAIAACLLLGSATLGMSASAQDGTIVAQDGTRNETVIVFDGSNSMWGQIDGAPKIALAQEMLRDVWPDLSAGSDLGLVAYGHRRKGDCGDIETLLPVARQTAIPPSAIDRIQPRGKTPITGALEQAARLIGEGANPSIILISDGIETCGGDPCQAAARLKELGVGVTTHVIGLGVTKREDREQLQCIAREGGGLFRTADNAQGLADALSDTRDAVIVGGDPQPAGPRQRYLALNGIEGPVVDGADFIVFDARTGEIVEGADSLPTGRYRVRATARGLAGEATITVEENDTRDIVIVMERDLPDASIQAAPKGPAGGELLVSWTGPAEDGDYIGVFYPDAVIGESPETFTYVRNGNPVSVGLPAAPGNYELRYVRERDSFVLATEGLVVVPAEGDLKAPATIKAGEIISLEWVGTTPGGNSYYSIAEVDASAGSYVDYVTFVQQVEPQALRAPVETGQYELRLIQQSDAGPEIIEKRPIVVETNTFRFEAPSRVKGGTTFTVLTEGPKRLENDSSVFVTVARVEDGDGTYIGGSWDYVGGFDTISLTAPDEPGAYEVRHVVSGRAGGVMARRSLIVE